MEDQFADLLIDASHAVDELEHNSFQSMRKAGIEHAADADVTIVGVPFDAGTYKRFGTHEGPMAIRKGLAAFRSYSLELGIDIFDHLDIADVGNISVTDWRDYRDTFEKLGRFLEWAYRSGKLPIVLGGDHSLAYQTIRSYAAAKGVPIGLVWIDNHFDCWAPFHGDPYFCGCPLRQVLLDEPLVKPGRVVHIGARNFSNSSSSARNAFELGFRWIGTEEFRRRGLDAVLDEALSIAFEGTDHVYVTLDIDVADVTFAPGTQSPRPGGLSSWELLPLVRLLGAAGCSGFDLMEVASKPDVEDFTALLAAESILEFIGGHAFRKAHDVQELGGAAVGLVHPR